MTRLGYSVLGLAAVGFFAALIVHVAAFLGKTYRFDLSSDYLFVGLFLVWTPTVLLVNSSGLKQGRRWNWRAVLRGCPKYLQWAMWILFGYSLVSIGLQFIYKGEMGSQLYNARAVSSAFLAMYSAAACILYSVTHAEKSPKEAHSAERLP